MGPHIPVSQWCDDQPLCTADELVLIDEVYVSDRDETLVRVLVEVEPSLFVPLKVCRRLDVHLNLKTCTQSWGQILVS